MGAPAPTTDDPSMEAENRSSSLQGDETMRDASAVPVASGDPMRGTPATTLTGSRRNIMTSPLRAAKERRKRELLLSSELFDPAYYQEQLTAHGITLPREDDRDALAEHYLATAHRLKLDPHPLFRSEYYLELYPDVERAQFNPLLHFLRDGNAEQRAHHPLFSPTHYAHECKRRGERGSTFDIFHYLRLGRFKGIRPHLLFDPAYYCAQVPSLEVGEALFDFVSRGWRAGLNPNPLFDTRYYLAHSPDVARSGLNPVEHFIRWGWREWRRASSLFNTEYYIVTYNDVRSSGVNPLEHYFAHGWREGRFTTEWYAPSLALSTAGLPRTSSVHPPVMPREHLDHIDVFCVYGASNVDFIREVALPHYARVAQNLGITVHLVNYRENVPLFPRSQELAPRVRAIDWSEQRENTHIGFGPAHNFLFEKVSPSSCFVLANPDSYPYQGCLEHLATTWANSNAGIVEARQWPSEHPKEYSRDTLETPWASGAFSLVDAKAFTEIGGFDPVFFLYTEDVDLSWRMWRAGHPVLYQREALCCHLTGHLSYRRDRYYYESYYSFRNFLVMARKFFGEEGEFVAERILHASKVPAPLRDSILRDYRRMRSSITPCPANGHWALALFGLNLYHRFQSDTGEAKTTREASSDNEENSLATGFSSGAISGDSRILSIPSEDKDVRA